MNVKTDIQIDEVKKICNELEKFIDEYNSTLNLFKTILNKTKDQWNGEDYKKFELKYNEIISNKSAADNAKQQLSIYYDYLSQVYELYREAIERTMKYARKLN